jgi:L-threonylcarbamoyladenylate synthase
VGVESTVLDLVSSGIRILRPGGISREELERVTGHIGEGRSSGGDPACSPGMLKSHYAPLVPLTLHTEDNMARLSPRENEAYLFFSDAVRRVWLANAGSSPALHSAALSETGNAREAAANLFDLLHRLEALCPARIHAELLPEDSGLGAAVNDRLRRAAAAG